MLRKRGYYQNQVDTFSRMVVLVAKQLFDLYPETIRELAAKHYNPWNEDVNSTDCINFTEGEQDKDLLVADNIRVHNNFKNSLCNLSYSDMIEFAKYKRESVNR